jgi:hypothetical protein
MYLAKVARKAAVAVLLLSVSLSSACYGRGAGLAFFVGAVTAAAIISATAPPPPRVVYVPAPRAGYVWQPGYWTHDDEGDWLWVDGRWIAEPPGWVWQPTRWQETPDGQWQLVPGRWVEAGPG